jgi:hypothetical protein
LIQADELKKTALRGLGGKGITEKQYFIQIRDEPKSPKQDTPGPEKLGGR